MNLTPDEPVIHLSSPDGPVALLIDGENMSFLLIGRLLAQAERYGCVTVRQVYLKHSSRWVIRSGEPQPKGAWYDAAACYDVEVRTDVPEQAGRNAVDVALTVGAMDLFHAGLRQFCLATSDSDFVALVSRLRAANGMVIGVGNTTTPSVLREAYTCFVETGDLPPPVPWTRYWEIVEVAEPQDEWKRQRLRKRRTDGTGTFLAITTVDVELLQA